jgi:hypothetical protein
MYASTIDAPLAPTGLTGPPVHRIRAQLVCATNLRTPTARAAASSADRRSS